jgi:hypothetical protein
MSQLGTYQANKFVSRFLLSSMIISVGSFIYAKDKYEKSVGKFEDFFDVAFGSKSRGSGNGSSSDVGRRQ